MEFCFLGLGVKEEIAAVADVVAFKAEVICELLRLCLFRFGDNLILTSKSMWKESNARSDSVQFLKSPVM